MGDLSCWSPGGGADLGFPPHYKAAADIPTGIEAGADEKVLRIRGLKVDTVISTSGFGDGLPMLLQDPNTPHRTFKDFKRLSKSDGRTLPTKYILMLALAFRRPLFLRYWYLALEKYKGDSPVDLIDAFIKCTTVDQFGLAGSNSEPVRKDGCAYLFQQLQLEKQRRYRFLSALPSHVPRRQGLSELDLMAEDKHVPLESEVPIWKYCRSTLKEGTLWRMHPWLATSVLTDGSSSHLKGG